MVESWILAAPPFRSMPFFDQRRVVELLDRLPQVDDGARIANDQVLMYMLRLYVLHERFRLAA